MQCMVKNPAIIAGKALCFELVGEAPDMEWEAGETLHLEIKRPGKRRSLDANAYCWVLLDRLAERMGVPKTELYRGYIREIGGNSETVCVLERAAQKLCEGWGHNGLGWVSETMASKLPGCVNVTLYYGSSTYDTRQMSRLIDAIVEDCREVGIETATPMELARLKEEWGGTK